MSNLNEKPYPQSSGKFSLGRRFFIILGSSTIVLLAIAVFIFAITHPKDFSVQPISSAAAAGNKFISLTEARQQLLADASPAVHGAFVKDPYGCIYAFQYLAAQLSLIPILDEQQKPICQR